MRTSRAKIRRTVKKFLHGAAAVAGKQLAAKLDGLRPSLEAVGIITKAAGDQPIPPEVIDAILAGLDFAAWADLIPDLEPLLLKISEDGVRAAWAQLGTKPTIDMLDHVNEYALAYARERSAELVGMRYLPDGSLAENPSAEWAITDSTRDMLRTSVEEAVQEGWSGAEFADHLSDTYAFSEARAEAIARTETAFADVQGNLEGWKLSGVVEGKICLLSDDHPEPDECDDAADMGEVPLDDDFGGLGDPPFHTNCECDVAPVVLSEEEGGPSDETIAE